MGLTPERIRAIQGELDHCNKCGFCLPACPTYLETGSEVASPRGRLAYIEAVINQEMPVGLELADAFSLCLGCRACEVACPSGVGYGTVYEATRATLYETAPAYTIPARVRPLLSLVKHRRRFRQALEWGTRLRFLLPPALRRLSPERLPLPTPLSVAAGNGAPAAYFLGCVSETVYADANQDAIWLLGRGGFAVSVPPGQECCGALHMHIGDQAGAKRLARHNVATFESVPGPIVNHAGGCGAFLKAYGQLLEDDEAWRERAEKFASRVEDLTESLERCPRPLRFAGKGHRVGLQNSCHLVNVQKIGALPRRWLQAVEGDTYVELAGTDQCCGSAGLYNLVQPGMADRIVDHKQAWMNPHPPDILVVNNPGCALQWEQAVRKSGSPMRVQYLSRYLREHLADGNGEIPSGPIASDVQE